MHRCGFCQAEFIPNAPSQRYCSPSHKSEAYKARRTAAVQALTAIYAGYGCRERHIEDAIEYKGMRWATWLLALWGFQYDGERWTKGHT
jgi:hypothetical protein